MGAAVLAWLIGPIGRWLIVGAVGLTSLWGWGEYRQHQGDVKGYARGHAESVALAASYQEAAAKQAIAHQQEIAEWQNKLEVNQNVYATNIAGWRARFAAVSVQHASAGSGAEHLPPIPSSPGQIQGKPADVVSVAEYRALQEKCGEATLMFVGIRDAWDDVVKGQK